MAQTPKALRRAKKALDRGAYVTAYLLARSYCEGSTAFDKGHGLSIGIMHVANSRYASKVLSERMAAKWRNPAPRVLGAGSTAEVFDEVAPEHKQALADYIEKTKNDTGFFSEDCVE